MNGWMDSQTICCTFVLSFITCSTLSDSHSKWETW